MDIGFIGNTYFDLQFTVFFGSYINDRTVGQGTIGNYNLLVINTEQCSITDLDFCYCSFASIGLILNNVISYYKRLEKQKKHATGKIGKSTLQCKTYSHTSSTQKCRN